MNVEEFTKTYCAKCGTQRCEGIESEWGEGCQYRWNLDGMDPATEIKRLNDKIWELTSWLNMNQEEQRASGTTTERAASAVLMYLLIILTSVRSADQT